MSYSEATVRQEASKSNERREICLYHGPTYAAILSLLAAIGLINGCALTSGSNNGGGPVPPGPLAIHTPSLPPGQVQSGYEGSLAAAGGKQPYTWSIIAGALPSGLSLTASSGTISGTPTAAGKSTFTIQVEDTSSPITTATASVTISVDAIGNALAITTVGLPSGALGTGYNANLSAIGGTTPYSWNVASGQLPTGLTLNASGGTISGTPTAAGAYSFTMNVTDSSTPTPQTASESFGITISGSGGGVGPYTSRTDFALIPLPLPLPSVGGATGAGTCVTEPGYNNIVCRVTDIATLGANNTVPNDQEFSSCCDGWADINSWNSNSTMFAVETGGAGLVVMSFDPATHTSTPLYVKDGALDIGGVWWSYSNPQLAYTLAGGNGSGDPVISSVTFSSQTTPPVPVVFANLASLPNCVPALAGATKWRELAVSHDEQTFVLGAGTGGQGSAIYAIVYNVTNGCRWYNTQTGQIGGNWGPAGQATTSDTFTLHSIRISADGQTVLLSPSSSTADNRYVWNIASLSVTTANNSMNTGHFAVGSAGFVNSAGVTGDGHWCKYGMTYRTFGNLTNPMYVIPTVAQCGDTEILGDDHASWNNDDTSDNQPFFTSTVTIPLGTPITTAWQNEILGFSMSSPGTVWRFLSTYNTGTSQFFTCQNGIGTVSQDGKWFMFTSDWGNTLGLDAAGNNRCDVFVGQLK